MKLITLIILCLSLSHSASALERLCDPATEDCRAPLIALIRAEPKGIDAAWWFMEDSRYSVELIKRHRAGVSVRVIADLRANETYKLNAVLLKALADAGIPIRHKTSEGIMHWKMMLFDGQNTVEFGSANFSGDAFTPRIVKVNYTDETVYFTDKLDLVNSFRTRFDDLWIDQVNYASHANVSALARRYPVHPISPELNFVPLENFAERTAKEIHNERTAIDVIQYRITDNRQVEALLAARARNTPVRLITEPKSYRSADYPAHAANVDRLFAAGVEVKHRAHLGLNHEKLTILHGQSMSIFGSSNWSVSSASTQEEHNLFTRDTAVYQWFKAHFERKWNAASEFTTFVPMAPTRPVLALQSITPAAPSPHVLIWEGGLWSQSYDVYLGTQRNPPLWRAGVVTGGNAPGVGESLSVGQLQPSTRYFWRVVGRTAAGKEAASAVRSFMTAASEEQ